jgi:hypothetical protein
MSYFYRVIIFLGNRKHGRNSKNYNNLVRPKMTYIYKQCSILHLSSSANQSAYFTYYKSLKRSHQFNSLSLTNIISLTHTLSQYYQFNSHSLTNVISSTHCLSLISSVQLKLSHNSHQFNSHSLTNIISSTQTLSQLSSVQLTVSHAVPTPRVPSPKYNTVTFQFINAIDISHNLQLDTPNTEHSQSALFFASPLATASNGERSPFSAFP